MKVGKEYSLNLSQNWWNWCFEKKFHILPSRPKTITNICIKLINFTKKKCSESCSFALKSSKNQLPLHNVFGPIAHYFKFWDTFWAMRILLLIVWLGEEKMSLSPLRWQFFCLVLCIAQCNNENKKKSERLQFSTQKKTSARMCWNCFHLNKRLALQHNLTHLKNLLKYGGTMGYAVCTILKSYFHKVSFSRNVFVDFVIALYSWLFIHILWKSIGSWKCDFRMNVKPIV